MTVTQTHALSVSQGNGAPVQSSVTITGTAEANLSTTATKNTTTQRAWAVPHASITSIFILSDLDITFNTNASDASGGNSLSLKAGKPYEWFTGCPAALVLTADVTTLYLINASVSTDANLTVLCTYTA